jgi:hypothetical protein
MNLPFCTSKMTLLDQKYAMNAFIFHLFSPKRQLPGGSMDYTAHPPY